MIGLVIMCIGLAFGFLIGFTVGFVVNKRESRERKPQERKPQEVIKPNIFYEYRNIETIKIARLIDERNLMSFGDEFIEHSLNQISAELGKFLKDNGFIDFRITDDYTSCKTKKIIASVQAVKQELTCKDIHEMGKAFYDGFINGLNGGE